jgi:predicted metal-dependent hydrolase
MTERPPANIAIEAIGQMLADKRRWTQGALARYRTGREAPPTRGAAWDLLGATYKVLDVRISDETVDRQTNLHAVVFAHIQEASLLLHQRSAERVNDELGHDAVMAVLRLAYRRSQSSSLADAG